MSEIALRHPGSERRALVSLEMDIDFPIANTLAFPQKENEAEPCFSGGFEKRRAVVLILETSLCGHFTTRASLWNGTSARLGWTPQPDLIQGEKQTELGFSTWT